MKKLNRSTGRLLALWLAGIAAISPMAPLHAQDGMNAPGVEGAALAAREGWWDVVETSWARPGAEPEVIRGQVAHRQMVGLYLQEMLYAPGKRANAKVHRMDYLGFNRVTGRWDYLSMDTRVAAGLMPAWSFEHDDPSRIRVQFEPFSTPGGGGAVRGQLLRMEEIIEQTGPDSETKDQYFILADGSGTKWLGHRYAYVRQKGCVPSPAAPCHR